MTNDDLIEKLGKSQQKVMSLTVRLRQLEIKEQRARERAEVLDELVTDVVNDLNDGVMAIKVRRRIAEVMKKLEMDQ